MTGPNIAKEAEVDWAISTSLVAYPDALTYMQARAEAIYQKTAPELVWLLEHPALYTAGTSASRADLRDPERFPVFQAGRGGQYTYHGPGQRVAYVMLDLRSRGRDVRQFVTHLEQWIIATLSHFGVRGERREGRVGVWVDRTRPASPLREDKIAAIGVRLKRWISFHGISINVEPDLNHFEGITPCGIEDPRFGVTSLVDLGIPAGLGEVDVALKAAFESVFQARTRPSDVILPAALGNAAQAP